MSEVDAQPNEHYFFNDPSLNYPTIILLIFFAPEEINFALQVVH